jgi:hypothetical protein
MEQRGVLTNERRDYTQANADKKKEGELAVYFTNEAISEVI